MVIVFFSFSCSYIRFVFCNVLFSFPGQSGGRRTGNSRCGFRRSTGAPGRSTSGPENERSSQNDVVRIGNVGKYSSVIIYIHIFNFFNTLPTYDVFRRAASFTKADSNPQWPNGKLRLFWTYRIMRQKTKSRYTDRLVNNFFGDKTLLKLSVSGCFASITDDLTAKMYILYYNISIKETLLLFEIVTIFLQ